MLGGEGPKLITFNQSINHQITTYLSRRHAEWLLLLTDSHSARSSSSSLFYLLEWSGNLLAAGLASASCRRVGWSTPKRVSFSRGSSLIQFRGPGAHAPVAVESAPSRSAPEWPSAPQPSLAAPAGPQDGTPLLVAGPLLGFGPLRAILRLPRHPYVPSIPDDALSSDSRPTLQWASGSLARSPLRCRLRSRSSRLKELAPRCYHGLCVPPRLHFGCSPSGVRPPRRSWRLLSAPDVSLSSLRVLRCAPAPLPNYTSVTSRGRITQTFVRIYRVASVCCIMEFRTAECAILLPGEHESPRSIPKCHIRASRPKFAVTPFLREDPRQP